MMIINYVNYCLTRWTFFSQLTHTADDAKAKHVPSSRGLLKQDNQELCISSNIVCLIDTRLQRIKRTVSCNVLDCFNTFHYETAFILYKFCHPFKTTVFVSMTSVCVLVIVKRMKFYTFFCLLTYRQLNRSLFLDYYKTGIKSY